VLVTSARALRRLMSGASALSGEAARLRQRQLEVDEEEEDIERGLPDLKAEAAARRGAARAAAAAAGGAAAGAAAGERLWRPRGDIRR